MLTETKKENIATSLKLNEQVQKTKMKRAIKIRNKYKTRHTYIIW
jgi:hypothetical protein